jgi:ATP-binding cassette, subfamily B, bacterial PglK
VAGLVYGGILPVVSLISSAVLVLAILSALLAINAPVAVIAAATVGISYALVTRWARRRLETNGQRIAREQTMVLKALQEGLGGIRDVLLDGTQEFYCRVYVEADRPLRRAQGSNQFVASAPRFVIEAVAMVIIAVIAYGLTQGQDGLTSALPVLGALALGAQRLLQGVQMAYAAWAGMAGSRASLADALDLLDQPLPAIEPGAATRPLQCREGIHFRHVDYRYTSEAPWILKNFDLSIPRGSRLGIVGTTGSGKSTLLDLMMGLLIPEHGEVLVDDMLLTLKNLSGWQRLIAHVPQQIYLADSSIAENIAFGMSRESIDFTRVRSAARQANIAEFIENSKDGYDTRVGERGIRLSGGQRQRIGIARALYKQAEVLVFDEATSALDSVTETAVMEAIGELNRELTVIMIAHRLSTVRRCDTIIELDRGQVVASGTFDELLVNSASFRKLAATMP